MATDEQEGNVYQTNLCFCGLSSALKTPVDAWCDRGIPGMVYHILATIFCE